MAWRWSGRGGKVGLADLSKVDEEGGNMCVLRKGQKRMVRVRPYCNAQFLSKTYYPVGFLEERIQALWRVDMLLNWSGRVYCSKERRNKRSDVCHGS